MPISRDEFERGGRTVSLEELKEKFVSFLRNNSDEAFTFRINSKCPWN